MDAQTFQREVLKVERLLYHLCYAMLRNESDCEDVIQEALLRAWQKRDQLRDEAVFRSWICRITANTCIEWLRRRKRETSLSAGQQLRLSSADRDFEQLAMKEALDALTPEIRVCMTLHYLDGWPVSEVAQMLGIPEGTVKTRLMKGRQRMNALLREVEA